MGGFRNSEGYSDSTAGRAMASMNSGKIDKVTEKARRIRMMSNQQMIDYIEQRCAKAKSEGYNMGRREAVRRGVPGYEECIKKLMMIRGVGEKMAKEIMVVLYGQDE